MTVKKKEKKTASAKQAAPAAAPTPKAPVEPSEPVAFPRGTGSSSDAHLSAIEIREINDRVSREVAMESIFTEDNTNDDMDEDTPSSKDAKKRKRLATDVKEKRPKVVAGVERPSKKVKRGKQVTEDSDDEKPKEESNVISNITFKRLAVGMKFLGVIKEVNDLDAVVALPNQLTGFISITEVSASITSMVELAAAGDNDTDDIPSLTRLLNVGQIIPCTIVALEGHGGPEEESAKRRIELSIRPSFCNSGVKKTEVSVGMPLVGSVVSVEDHGYVLDLGVEGVQGFLLKKKSAAYRAKHCQGGDFSVGQPVTCCVLEVNEDSRVLSLSADGDAFVKTPVPKSSIVPFESLLPGMLIAGRVKSIKSNGIAITFMELFEGAANLAHLEVFHEDELKKKYKVGQSVTVRLLFLDPEQKIVGFSRRKAFVEWAAEPMPVNFGHTFDAVEVVLVEEKLGMFVKCPGGLTGHIHISRVSDTRITSIEAAKYREGTKHTARAVGYDWNDGLLLLSLKPSVINSPFLRKEDIETGAIVKGTITKIETYGIHVNLAEHITALIPQSHLSETRLTNPSKLFKVGMSVKCRVLANDIEAKKITLTLKKSLINSTLPIIKEYDAVNVGVVTNGYVMAVKDFGCIVGFYNDVRAIAPLAELSDRFVRHASELFTVGEVVKCRITVVDPAAQRMTASMKIFVAAESNLENVNIGQVVSGRVLSKLPDGVLFEVYPSLARGYLTKVHLSDHHDHVDLLMNALKEGTEISQLAVIDKDMKRGRAMVTMKPLLVQSAKDLEDKKELMVGDLVAAFVKSYTDTKLFLSFVNGKTGVAKINNVSDSYVSKVSELFTLGQTVQCRILSWNETTSQFEVTLKTSQLFDESAARIVDIPFLSSLFIERDSADDDQKAAKVWTQKYAIGATITGTIRQKTPYGLIVDTEDGDATGIVTAELAGSGGLEMGKKVTVRVLDADVGKRILDLKVVEGEEVGKVSLKILKKLQPLLESQEKIEALVEVVKTSYLILSIPSVSSVIVYAATRSFNNAAIASFPKLYKVGQKLRVNVSHIPTAGDKSKKGASSQRIFVSIAPTTPPEETTSKDKSDGKRPVKDAVDTSITCLEDLTMGRLVKGRIKSVLHSQINVILGSNLRGRVHVTEIASILDQIDDAKYPFKQYKSGSVIECKVVGFHENGKSHKFLPITHRNPASRTIVELSLRPTDLALASGQLDEVSRNLTLDNINEDEEYLGFVSKTSNEGIWLSLSRSLLGRVHVLECSDDIKVLQNLSKNFPLGKAVTCKVISKNLDKSELNLTLREESQHDMLANAEKGQKLFGKVTKVDAKKGISVQISDHMFGRASFADVSEALFPDPTKIEVGTIVTCFIVGKQNDSGNILLSIGEEMKEEVEINEGDIVKGVVKNLSEGGLFVDLGRGLTGRVMIKDLSDNYVKDWKSLFEVGDKVVGKIVSADSDNKRYGLSLRQSAVNPGAAAEQQALSIESLKKGMKVKGSVKGIETYGIFIRIEGSNLSGLCHKTEISDTPFTSISSLYEVGDPVKAVILKVDEQKKKISFGLKASYFDDDDASDGDEEEKVGKSSAMEVDEEDEEEEEEADEDVEMSDDASIPDVDAMEAEDVKVDDGTTGAPIDYMKYLEPLDIDAESDIEESDDDVMEDDTTEDTPKSKSRRQKKRQKEQTEEKIRQQEEALLEDSAPDSAEAFERLLLGSPNSSFLWIKFMAYFLQIADIPKARDVAERALKAISFREAAELLNVWVALLNLENAYGDRETLQKVFNRAVAYCEPKAVFMHMAKIYERTNKTDDLDQLFLAMVKRFKESCKVWVAYGLSLMKRNKLNDARNVLSKSLKSLAKRKHLKIICKFAQMEFKMGEPERGRTLFEGIISNHPKRLDMWSIYLDMETKQGDVALTRRLFDRAITLKLSSKKMKFLFKKYLEFESNYGTEAGAENVKQKAMEYVESISSA